ncbi:MAG: PilZ domain-containing protein [Nitrospira sp.]|nr:MAG: PilZ domain-containing protein [Nitrospira sp.]
MKLYPVQHAPEGLNHSATERRDIDRIPLSFSLMYSGANETRAILGHGTVIDMSREGLGLRGSQPVNVGMDLLLLLSPSDTKHPPVVIQAQVAWIDEHRFGLRFTQSPATSALWLQRFLRSFFHMPRASKSA